MAQAPQARLFAFTSSDSAATWQAVNDGVMGGVSDGRFRITERQTLEFYGTLSLTLWLLVKGVNVAHWEVRVGQEVAAR